MEIFVIAILGGTISAVIAANKNRNAVGWFFFGFLLPLIGIVMICALPAEPAPSSVAAGGAPGTAS